MTTGAEQARGRKPQEPQLDCLDHQGAKGMLFHKDRTKHISDHHREVGLLDTCLNRLNNKYHRRYFQVPTCFLIHSPTLTSQDSGDATKHSQLQLKAWFQQL